MYDKIQQLAQICDINWDALCKNEHFPIEHAPVVINNLTQRQRRDLYLHARAGEKLALEPSIYTRLSDWRDLSFNRHLSDSFKRAHCMRLSVSAVASTPPQTYAQYLARYNYDDATLRAALPQKTPRQRAELSALPDLPLDLIIHSRKIAKGRGKTLLTPQMWERNTQLTPAFIDTYCPARFLMHLSANPRFYELGEHSSKSERDREHDRGPNEWLDKYLSRGYVDLLAAAKAAPQWFIDKYVWCSSAMLKHNIDDIIANLSANPRLSVDFIRANAMYVCWHVLWQFIGPD